jgi:hypothetical protein
VRIPYLEGYRVKEWKNRSSKGTNRFFVELFYCSFNNTYNISFMECVAGYELKLKDEISGINLCLLIQAAETYVLRLLENRVLRKIFACTRKKVRRLRRKLRIDELPIYIYQHIIRARK